MPKKRSEELQEEAPIAARTRRQTIANTLPPIQLRSKKEVPRSVALKRSSEEPLEPRNRKKAGTRSASRAPRRAAADQQVKTEVEEAPAGPCGAAAGPARPRAAKDTPTMPSSDGTASGEDMEQHTGPSGDHVNLKSPRTALIMTILSVHICCAERACLAHLHLRFPNWICEALIWKAVTVSASGLSDEILAFIWGHAWFASPGARHQRPQQLHR